MQHFLGYEGRAGYPSNFDTNYCYALGFTATLLINAGVTSAMCVVSHLTQPPEEWEIGALPLPAIMHVELRKGVQKPVLQKALVDLQGGPFTYFQKLRDTWALEDAYCHPGPMQFFGPSELTDTVPLTLQLESAT